MNKLIIFPTDTVYGIGCSIYDVENQNKIYKIKNRSKDKPLAVLCSSLSQIEKIAVVSDDAKKLIMNFLPGPLTLILPSKQDVKDVLGLDTIGVRIPNHEVALKIIGQMGPMTTTSVNDSGEKEMNEYDEIVKKYSKVVDYIYEPSGKPSNLASTVVLTQPTIKVIREGAISLADIENVLK